MHRENATQLEPALPGLERVKRYWDKNRQITTARILPGEYYVTIADEMIATVLGSCVSACIRDRQTGIGGMNHFMLPQDGGESRTSQGRIATSTRYGVYAMEHLINTILSRGGYRKDLEIKLFGGGRVLATTTDIGASNIHFVRDYLRREKLPVEAEDLGGVSPRKILYFPSSGRVLMRKIPIAGNEKHCQRERNYQKSLEKPPLSGETELLQQCHNESIRRNLYAQ